ncbi:ATP-binding protein [Streptomyces sp. NPDC002722]|uniref:ATP-binding protein n=1 Tax=Streptomyces sp. NPDC002722 TaxID=3154425 RepID=UPI003316F6C7
MNKPNLARLAPMVSAMSAKVAPVKTMASATRSRATNAADALSPLCVPLASRWDEEAGRRTKLRTPEHLKALIAAQREHGSARVIERQAAAQRRIAKKDSKNPFTGVRRAARTADKAAKAHRRSAKADLKAARADYPLTLNQVAVRAHAAHLVPAGIASYVLSTPQDWTTWPAATSTVLVAMNAVGVWLGRRTVVAQIDDEGLSAEERRLMERLDPTYWVQHAEEQGLERTLTERPEITPAGIVCGVRLDGKGRSAKWLASEEAAVRRLLGMKTETRMQIGTGSHGDRALIMIRTRSASDGLDLKGWKPGDVWAVDTVTGETVPAPLGKRTLIAGTSGSGKSTSARPLMAEASEREDHRLVIFDRKYVEGRTWEHRARVACELPDMRTVVRELLAEGEERLKSLPRGEDTVAISKARPRITVFVDEGAELLSDCAAKYKDADDKNADYLDVVAGLRTVARKYRAAEIIVVWATQKPTLSGDGHGLDSQIAGQLTIRLALAVATSTETQAVFGPDAIEKGWKAHELPMPWVAMLRDQDKGPKQRTHPLRMRWMTAQQVIDLPARPIWRREAAPAEVPAPASAAKLRLVKNESVSEPAAEVPTPRPEAAPVSNRDKVIGAVADGARTNRDVSDRTGINKGSVSKLVKALVDSGDLVKDPDHGLVLGGAEEVSA